MEGQRRHRRRQLQPRRDVPARQPGEQGLSPQARLTNGRVLKSRPAPAGASSCWRLRQPLLADMEARTSPARLARRPRFHRRLVPRAGCGAGSHWLPFLTLAGLHFLVAAVRKRGAPPGPRGRIRRKATSTSSAGDGWLEPVLVEVDGHQVWLPTTDDDEEDAEDGEPSARLRPAPPPQRDLRPRSSSSPCWRSSSSSSSSSCPTAAGAIWTSPTGRGRSAPLGRSGTDRRAHGARPLRRRTRGGRDRPACRRRRRGRWHERLPDARDLLSALGSRSRTTRPSARPPERSRCSRTRRHLRGEDDEGVTNCYAFQSGGRARPPARPLRRNGGPDDAATADRERDLCPLRVRLPRARRVPRRRRLDLDPGSGRFLTSGTSDSDVLILQTRLSYAHDQADVTESRT